jgi:hypothetical protein
MLAEVNAIEPTMRSTQYDGVCLLFLSGGVRLLFLPFIKYCSQHLPTARNSNSLHNVIIPRRRGVDRGACKLLHELEVIIGLFLLVPSNGQ